VFPVRYKHIYIQTSKAIPISGRGNLCSCDRERLPHLLDNRLIEGVEVVSLKSRPRFTIQVDSCYSFPLEAGSNPGTYCGWKDSVN
jgi:hypothetical protein